MREPWIRAWIRDGAIAMGAIAVAACASGAALHAPQNAPAAGAPAQLEHAQAPHSAQLEHAPAPRPAQLEHAPARGQLGATERVSSSAFSSMVQGAAATPPDPPRSPQVHVALATVGDGLDAKVVSRLIERSSSRITYCYEKERLGRPALAGRLDVQFEIGADGRVTSATATGFDERVGTCVADAVGQIRFPRPAKGRTVQVTGPITFAY